MIVTNQATDTKQNFNATSTRVPLRQLSRLTVISYGVIQRINGKMKLGQ